jgi:hypothetical protein
MMRLNNKEEVKTTNLTDQFKQVLKKVIGNKRLTLKSDSSIRMSKIDQLIDNRILDAIRAS